MTEADDGHDAVVRLGGLLEVDLEETPTTGYRWALTDTGPLEPLGDDFELAEGAAIGGGGRRRFRFAATKLGNGRLELELRREWEAAPRSRFAVGVTVED